MIIYSSFILINRNQFFISTKKKQRKILRKKYYMKHYSKKKYKNMNYKKIKVFQRNTINPKEIANLDY